jgi:ESF2/ABP1 family protein
MAKLTDERFALSDTFYENSFASPSKSMSGQVSDSESLFMAEDSRTSGQDSEQDNVEEMLGDGMDTDGFGGPRVVKPLTPEALAAFKAAQEKAGVIYISRIPPGMQPMKVRHLMSQYGEVGRVYLQKEGMAIWVPDHD